MTEFLFLLTLPTQSKWLDKKSTEPHLNDGRFTLFCHAPPKRKHTSTPLALFAPTEAPSAVFALSLSQVTPPQGIWVNGFLRWKETLEGNISLSSSSGFQRLMRTRINSEQRAGKNAIELAPRVQRILEWSMGFVGSDGECEIPMIQWREKGRCNRSSVYVHKTYVTGYYPIFYYSRIYVDWSNWSTQHP